ncbi:adenylate cyclase type 9-like [Colossoma macropomum]|uniref:adenylate cyclase type 9-like n=1 Tax=Colossoma macropomum TaxID=42526 RepID=UPI001865379B|nr:adenylate cyclase type 9-like [Colossoma macropomum]
MASPHHLQLHNSEVCYDSSGDGAVCVRISSIKQPKQQRCSESLGSNTMCGFVGGSKYCKYSISSSCSSGESGIRRPAVRSLRNQRKMPQLFERSVGPFWNPKFDSSILEDACRKHCFPQTQRHFRCVLFYLAVASLLWGVYFSANADRCDYITFLVPTASFLFFCFLLFLFTFTRHYAHCYDQASLLLIIVTFTLTLVPQTQTSGFRDLYALTLGDGNDAEDLNGIEGKNLTLDTASHGSFLATCLSPVGTFSLGMEVLMLLYSVLHVRLYASVLLGLLYSVLFESLGWMHLIHKNKWNHPSEDQAADWETLHWLAPAKALLHLCAHITGIHLFIMSEVRSRSTFLKVGQAIMHGKDLEVEKALKERMIHSVMPRRVANELMKQSDEDENTVKRYSTGTALASVSSPRGTKHKKTSIPRGQIIFRPFNMKRMEPVSILFADIVGFTKMSANKTAHALVGLLNDLFGRFDHLCELTCCEKISTLGDCYYCVAGCPEPRPDHAYCCIEMGLGMIQAIEQFCQEKKEMVNMRVGVHTGTVLCGILGIKRFKFDVWSNDVNLANLMEQLGVAGKVHLSQATAKFLDDRYVREDGRITERIGQSVVADQLKGLKTYLISGRKMERSQCSCSHLGFTEAAQEESLSSNLHTQSPDLPGSASALLPSADRAKSPCPSCNVVLISAEDLNFEKGAVHNASSDEKTKDTKMTLNRNSLTMNGLLSPHREEALANSHALLCNILHEKEKKRGGGVVTTMNHSALIPLRSKNFRERSDAHFVDVIKEDSLMKDYFSKPPITKLSHNFLDKSLETSYRTSYQEEVKTQSPVQTFASPTFSSFLDMLLCCFVLLVLSLSCFLQPLVTHQSLPVDALIVTAVTVMIECLALVLAIQRAFFLDKVLNCTRTLLWFTSGWVPRHLIGAVLVSLPAVTVFSHITYNMHPSIQFTVFICCTVIITIIQYCNFCQLSFWMRSSLATMVGLVLLVVLWSHPSSAWERFFLRSVGSNDNNSSVVQSSMDPGLNFQNVLGSEAVLSFFLLLLLVWFLNREFEVSYRLHYHGNMEADQHRIKIQNMKDQADWLLRNIIPIHVADQLKVTQSYSKNHDNAGVIFGSIVNFSEFYEESYEGGKECYRVLNELIGDFDELLRKPDFSTIEKIKTIGATYMAASGLNTQHCSDQAHPHAHLRALFDFALEMMRVVDDFNKNMLGFKFKLRIGFNHGPLTAGVIGTTKLLYDIWGDTVNIASRMDTTGVECCVQVSEESYCVLSGMDYEFDYRGTVNVKGKGQMKTFLYPKSGDSGPVPEYQLSVSPEIRAQLDGSIGRSPTDEIANTVSAASSNGMGMSVSVSSGLVRQGGAVKEFNHKTAGNWALSTESKTQHSASAGRLSSVPETSISGGLTVFVKQTDPNLITPSLSPCQI